jgi:hypothetical protein
MKLSQLVQSLYTGITVGWSAMVQIYWFLKLRTGVSKLSYNTGPFNATGKIHAGHITFTNVLKIIFRSDDSGIWIG